MTESDVWSLVQEPHSSAVSPIMVTTFPVGHFSYVPVCRNVYCEGQSGHEVAHSDSRTLLKSGGRKKTQETQKEEFSPFAFFEFLAAIPPFELHAMIEQSGPPFPLNEHVGNVPHKEWLDLH